MNVSKMTRRCTLALVLGLAVAGSARGQDIGYRFGNTACTDCSLEISHVGFISEGTILDARWDGKYPLTAVSHDVRTLRIVKRIDAASPKLQEAFKKGTPFPEATLTVPRGESSQEYNPYITVDYVERISMKNVYITSYQTGGSQAAGSIPTETFSLNFSTIEFESQEEPGFVPEAGDEVIVGFEDGDDQGKAPAAGPLKPLSDLTKSEKAAPEQGRLAAALADLLPHNGLTVATSLIPWGQAATISTDDASSKQGGRCFFRYRYDTGNQGQAAAGPTTNRIHLDAASGPSLADDAVLGLAAGDQHTASGLLPLVVGTWTLYVHADDDLLVAEGDEQNNLRRVRVRVEGSCEDEAPTPKDSTPSPPAEIPSAISFPPSIEVENDADTDAPLGSRHSGVIQIAMMDGSVRMVSGSIRVVEPKDLAQSGDAAAGQGPRLLQACAQGEPIKVEVERGSTLEVALTEAYRKKMPFGVLQDTDAMGHSCKVTSVEPSMSDPQMLVFYLGGY